MGTCAGADIHRGSSEDTAGNTCTGGGCIQLHIAHADPTLVGTAPDLRSDSGGFVNIDISAVCIVTDMCIAGTCCCTDTQYIAIEDSAAGNYSCAAIGGAVNSTGATNSAAGQIHIFHFAGFHFGELDIVQADPALFGQTPLNVADLLLQADLNLVIALIGANLCILGACTCADIDIVSSDNGADCGNLLSISVILNLAGLIVGILQCDPALFGLAPLVVAALLDSGQQQLLALIVGTVLCIVGARTNAVVNTAHGNGNRNRINCGTGLLVDGQCCQAVADIDPTLGDLAPLLAGAVHILSSNSNLLICLVSALLFTARSIVDASLLTVGRIATVRNSNTLDGAIIVLGTLAVLPTGIQLGGTGALGAQLGDASTAFVSGGIPTQETVTGLTCDSRLHSSRLVGVVTLNGNGGNNTCQVAIIDDILVVCRRSRAVCTIEVQICLAQTALDQAAYGCTASLTKLSHGIDEFVAGSTIDNRSTEGTGTLHPAGAQIICKGYQCIKLLLVQLQAVSINKGIHRLFKAFQVFLQQQSSLSFGDTVFIVVFQSCTGNSGTITNSPLTVVHLRPLNEAFKVFQHCNTLIAGLHCRCCRNSRNCTAHQTQDNN